MHNTCEIKLREALQYLVWNYGVGTLVSFELTGDNVGTFTTKGYRLEAKTRRFTIKGKTVHAYGRQRTIK